MFFIVVLSFLILYLYYNLKHFLMELDHEGIQ